MMVEHLKHEGTLHSSSDPLKICVKKGGNWSVQVFMYIYIYNIYIYRHVQRGGRRVLEHLPLCHMMPKVPFCQGDFFFIFFF